MAEILLLSILGFLIWLTFRCAMAFYMNFRPQIVKVNDLYYLRKLSSPFSWEYARNLSSYACSSTVYFDSFNDVFGTGNETARNTSHGHATKEKAEAFLKKYFLEKNKKVKIERVDGLWFMCKNKLSQIKFRRNKK